MNSITLTCISSTATQKQDGFIVKLQTTADKSVVTAFGSKTQKSQTTYYIKLDTPVKVGFSAPLDLDMFTIVERPFDLEVDATPANPAMGIAAEPARTETVLLKWLQIK